MSNKQHKMGIIGFGGMGANHHGRAGNAETGLDCITVTSAYDIREEARAEATSKGLKAYDKLDEFLSADTDIVAVATPNNYHRELAIGALEAGKNVICEKPVTMNAAELEDIIAVSKRTGKLFAVHQNRRWDPDYVLVKKLLMEDDAIGKPYYIDTRVLGSQGSLHGWRGSKENGGGMLFDWGIHLLDQILWMIPSKVKSVYANLHLVKSVECDDNFRLNLTFENGVNALIEVATNCFITYPRWHICGVNGTMIIEDWKGNGKMIKGIPGEAVWVENLIYTAGGPTRSMYPRRPETIEETKIDGIEANWYDYYRNIVDVLDNGAELIVKPEESLRVMRVIDAAFKSSKEGISISGPF